MFDLDYVIDALKADEARNFEQLLFDRISSALQKQKKYANFWDWPDKQVKERGNVSDLLKSIEAEQGSHGVVKLRSNPPHITPDCVGTIIDGKLIGFEVTELVDQEAVELNETGHRVWKKWNHEELREKIRSIVTEKDRKTFQGGEYHSIVLIIYTDEPFLRPEDCAKAFTSEGLGSCQQITDVFLLFSYSRRKGSYTFLRLELDGRSDGWPHMQSLIK